ncbi:hypothetical protein HUJ05_000828 [Dendroctonus ponderosae]|nr:hypothetical protein HUJ05_000828 [Dendroctonus ponderosae]
MSVCKWFSFSHRRWRVIAVAWVHMILVLYGIYVTADDRINEQYPVNAYEIVYALCYYIVHFVLITLLVLGINNNWSILYVPWIIVFFAVFTAASYLWIESILKESISSIVAWLTNVTVLSFVWFGWWCVTKDFLNVRQKLSVRLDH